MRKSNMKHAHHTSFHVGPSVWTTDSISLQNSDLENQTVPLSRPVPVFEVQ